MGYFLVTTLDQTVMVAIINNNGLYLIPTIAFI